MAAPTSTARPDFANFDFTELWRGRSRTTDVEGEILRRLLPAPTRAGRVLEIGPGVGRLSPRLRAWFPDYRAVDAIPKYLTEPEAARRIGPHRYLGDAAHLPFADRTFDAVVMVRVFNFLDDPVVVLREIRRVLRPGGGVIFSYHAVPSIHSWEGDIRQGLGRTPRERGWPISVRAREINLWRRSSVAGFLDRSDLELAAERSCGGEDHRLMRRVPTAVWVGLSDPLGRWPLFPHRFVRARRRCEGSDAGRPGAGLFACPACRAGIVVDPANDPSWACQGCGAFGGSTGGVVDLRPSREGSGARSTPPSEP